MFDVILRPPQTGKHLRPRFRAALPPATMERRMAFSSTKGNRVTQAVTEVRQVAHIRYRITIAHFCEVSVAKYLRDACRIIAS